jgi:hypothetical protein
MYCVIWLPNLAAGLSVPIKRAGQNRGGIISFLVAFAYGGLGSNLPRLPRHPMALLQRRGPGPWPAVSINYAQGQSVRDYSLESMTGDNLISVDSKSNSTAMMSSVLANAANVGTRTNELDLMLAEATSRIKAIEEMMHPPLPLADEVATLVTPNQA